MSEILSLETKILGSKEETDIVFSVIQETTKVQILSLGLPSLSEIPLTVSFRSLSTEILFYAFFPLLIYKDGTRFSRLPRLALPDDAVLKPIRLMTPI